jgi:hypothetical protein
VKVGAGDKEMAKFRMKHALEEVNFFKTSGYLLNPPWWLFSY